MSGRSRPPTNLSASVRQRLLNISRETGEVFNALLVRFATERLLFRISRSAHADAFVLKGAWLFYVWEIERRATRDVDFLAFGEATVERVTEIFRDILEVEVEPDGVSFAAETLRVEGIRDAATYPGTRVRIVGMIGTARAPVQVDIGYGDALVAAPEAVDVPALLDFPPPRLRAYSPETAVAEKVEAVVRFGKATTRFKDYFDLWVVAEDRQIDGALLRGQMRETFRRRGTPIPPEVPDGFSSTFAAEEAAQRQWAAFLRTSGARRPASERFSEVVGRAAQLVLPPLAAAARDELFSGTWIPAEGWR